MTAHLTIFQRALARRLRAKGMSLRAIAKEIGCSHSGIDVMLKGQARGPRPDAWTPREGHLTASEREEILLGLGRGESTKTWNFLRTVYSISSMNQIWLRWYDILLETPQRNCSRK